MTTDSSPPSSFSLLAGCARTALSVTVIVPVWLWLLVSGYAASAFPSLASSWLAGAVFAGLFLPVAAWVSLAATRDAAAERRLGLRDAASRVRRDLPTLVMATLFTLLTPTLFIALALAVSAVGRVPWVGPPLLVLWMATGGAVCGLLAAGWLVVGLPASLLQPAASVVEYGDAMEIASRTLSYVRRRPLSLAAASLGAVASAAAGSAVFAVFLSVFIACLVAMGGVGTGSFPDPAALLGAVKDLWRDPRVFWPFSSISSMLPWTFPSAKAAVIPAAWEVFVARLLPSFFVAALLSGMARVYLILRRAEDGVPITTRHEK